jgi:hypothetical protein
MTQTPNDQGTCNVCQQRFNSEHELREHQRNTHSQQKRGGESISEPDHEHKVGQGQPKHDKIA